MILFRHHSQIVHYYHVSCRRLLYLNLLSMLANIFKSLFYMQCKSFNFAPLGLIAYIWKRVILAFISFFWLQRSLMFVSNIYAIYLFISLSHCTGAGVVSVVMLSSLAALEVVISCSQWREYPQGGDLSVSVSLHTLKQKCCHFDEIFITDCTGSCQNDSFQCSQWWKFLQDDDIFVSV